VADPTAALCQFLSVPQAAGSTAGRGFDEVLCVLTVGERAFPEPALPELLGPVLRPVSERGEVAGELSEELLGGWAWPRKPPRPARRGEARSRSFRGWSA